MLVVDDNRDGLVVLVALLERLGYQVVCAEDGERELDVAAAFKP